MLSTVPALLVTLGPGLTEQNGWWHFDRSEYLHNPWPTSQLVSIMVLSVLWPSGFLSAVFLGATAPGSEIEPERLSICGRAEDADFFDVDTLERLPRGNGHSCGRSHLPRGGHIGDTDKNLEPSIADDCSWMMVIVGLPMLG